MDSFAWEMKRMANASNQKGNSKAWPEETKEEKSDKGEDKEKADVGSDEDTDSEIVDE